MKIRILIFPLILMVVAAWTNLPAIAQTDLSTNAPPANGPPQETSTPAPVVPVYTNEIPVLTNQFPTVKPKGSGGATILSAFADSLGRGYSVSGRTLKFPVMEATARAESDWRRNLAFGMTQARGNTDMLRYSLGVDARKEADVHTVRLKAHGAYGESDGTKDTENADATLRYERKLTTMVYALANLDLLTDPMAELDYRVTGILSPGLHLIRTRTRVLDLELGTGYVREKKHDDEEGYAAGRAAITAEQLMNNHVMVWLTAEYIPKLADPGVFFINAEVGLAAYLTRDLSLKVCCQERYDSDPFEGKKSSDTIISTAISLAF